MFLKIQGVDVFSKRARYEDNATDKTFEFIDALYESNMKMRKITVRLFLVNRI